MRNIYIDAVSVIGDGLLGVDASLNVLAGQDPLVTERHPELVSRLLTANNRRRTSKCMQLAIKAADEALGASQVDEKDIHFIFSSSECDLEICERNLQALAKIEKEISPKDFQNVILNAAAGHLGVFTSNNASSTTVSGHENNFGVALLEAAVHIETEGKNILLVAHDASSEMPYDEGVRRNFAMAMVLSADKSLQCIAQITVDLIGKENSKEPLPTPFAEIYGKTPAATSLPLLVALAQKKSGTVWCHYDQHWVLRVTLCC